MSDALLRLENVACRRGGRLLFRNIALTVLPGQALTVTGPNGAGKSSLIRLMAGLLEPIAGKVECGGAIAIADEHLALDERLPLRRALDYWARLDGRPVDGGLAAMGIAALADVPVRMLSAGQRKRASLARVITGTAPLWLLDEPLNALDDQGRALLDQAIADHRGRGGAVVAASHQPLGLEDAKVLDLTAPGESLA